MGNLAKRFETEKPHRRTCRFGVTFDSLDEEDKQVIRDCLSDNLWTVMGIVNFLNSENLHVSEKSISKHRKGLCLECKEAGL